MMPKPFTKIFLMAGEPVEVPPDISREEVDPNRSSSSKGNSNAAHLSWLKHHSWG